MPSLKKKSYQERKTTGIRVVTLNLTTSMYEDFGKLTSYFGISRVQIVRCAIEFLSKCTDAEKSNSKLPETAELLRRCGMASQIGQLVPKEDQLPRRRRAQHLAKQKSQADVGPTK